MADSTTEDRIPVLLFGGTGYVAGEALRLIVHHPRLALLAVYSTSQAGKPLTEVFQHLRGTVLDSMCFAPVEQAREAAELRERKAPVVAALFATPHGATAELVERLLATAAELGASQRLRVVDLSADFRFASAKRFEAVYGEAHPAPKRLAEFARGVPELVPELDPQVSCASQPGCFVTAAVLAAAPLLRAGLVEPDDIFVSAVTGSSGSGRTPRETTHHPERASTLFAYNPLGHRHEAEMRTLLAAQLESDESNAEPEVEFVPHSGPFVRGIHATLRLRLRESYVGASADQLLAHYEKLYEPEATGRFVRASREMPRLTEVVGTNRCHIGLAVRGRTVVVTSVLDNLVKGAAGGGIQWLNRLLGLDAHTGLRDLPGLGWF